MISYLERIYVLEEDCELESQMLFNLKGPERRRRLNRRRGSLCLAAF